jgi:predicted nucleic acid-binding Zn finger protein
MGQNVKHKKMLLKHGISWKIKRRQLMAFEAYKNRQYCLDELKQVREFWGNKKKFTPYRAERIAFALAGMYCNCPEDLQDIVLGALNECHMRAVLCFGIKTMSETPVFKFPTLD